jgi:hypothetical protein
MKSRQASDDAPQDRPRGVAASPRGKDNWEADVKLSPEPEGPASSRRKQPGPRDEGAVVESRWPYAIAIGAVAFAVGCLLPLFFRKHIMPDAARASVASVAQGASRPPSPVIPSTTTPTPAASTQAPSLSAEVKASAPTEPTATGTASVAAPARGGKPSGKPAGKGGRVGDIF